MSMSSKIWSKLVSFTVSSPSHPDLFKMTNVWIYNVDNNVDNLTLPKQKIDIEDLKGSYQHLHDLDFTLIGDSDAAILIGTDFPQWHWYRDIKTGKEHELIAIQSSLGWVLLGGKDNNKNTTSSHKSSSWPNCWKCLGNRIVRNEAQRNFIRFFKGRTKSNSDSRKDSVIWEQSQ